MSPSSHLDVQFDKEMLLEDGKTGAKKATKFLISALKGKQEFFCSRRTLQKTKRVYILLNLAKRVCLTSSCIHSWYVGT